MKGLFADNRIYVFDVETVELLPDGSKVASLEHYRPNFRIDSLAIAFRDGKGIKTEFAAGEDASLALLERCGTGKLVAHNMQFDLACILCRSPELASKLNFYACTARMSQLYDNGGDETSFVMVDTIDEDGTEDTEREWVLGNGLVNCVRRILHLPDHKEEAYKYLQTHHSIKPGKEGSNLHLLPPDVMERYNIGDVENCLKLYEHIEEAFLAKDFDWRFDHELFLSTVRHTIQAKNRGIRVDREQLAKSIAALDAEVTTISQAFLDKFAAPIKEVERYKLLVEVRKRKTLRGRKKLVKRVRSDPEYFKEHIAFNTGSNKQLARLFVDVLGIQPKFFTEKGDPSFKAAFLSQWLEGGTMLFTRRKRLIVLKQCQALYALSEFDGRWHLNLRIVGTKTGRGAGGS